MTSPIIDVTIDKNGNITLEVSGVSGSACHGLTAEMQNALGITTVMYAKEGCGQPLTKALPEQQKLGGSSG